MPNSLTSTLEMHLDLEPMLSFSAVEFEAEEIYETRGVVKCKSGSEARGAKPNKTYLTLKHWKASAIRKPKELTNKHHSFLMASAQCHKTCEQTNQQKNHNTSFGQKVSDFFKGHHNHHSNEVTKTHTTQCSSQTTVLSKSGYSATKTETQCSCSKTQTNTKGQEINKRGHKKGPVQDIKDRFSEHHNKNGNSDSSSSSDSESDNETCHKRKARLKLNMW
ncbi:unnamed protein product [Sphenostylis stenocarpa]|uniref:Uncharacterized protein n=1 Tax=Sphenostylis stenocarpa TaxID=92480 RepID=A0AA86VX68_9FABA|nr:unnamed protein product [Sphenostylis stenocarpa]